MAGLRRSAVRSTLSESSRLPEPMLAQFFCHSPLLSLASNRTSSWFESYLSIRAKDPAIFRSFLFDPCFPVASFSFRISKYFPKPFLFTSELEFDFLDESICCEYL